MQSALFIGRFQPFHKGHLDAIKTILKDNKRVIIAIGSAEKNFLNSNPLTASERFQLIDEALREAKIPSERFCIIPIRNVNNYALWVNHINIYVPPYTKLYTGSKLVKACYTGKYDKKNHGPEVIHLIREVPISASEVREAIHLDSNWESLVPPAVAKLLKEWGIPSRLEIIKDTMDITKYNNAY
ncbi:nicotinamide-nucleotide adenylyltransferase [Candidatus Gracilibacteria bacterium]|nr:nicotinamide-nucleotide adenylyltransferase [Candidatus Gracilibacteria bacterium]